MCEGNRNKKGTEKDNNQHGAPDAVAALSREIAQSNGDHRALKELKEREAKLERRRVENNLFIQAVSDATDFEQVCM